VANLDSREPVNANGFFRIGSNTKTFVSVVVLQLVAEHGLHHTYAPGTSTRLPQPHATGHLIFDQNTRSTRPPRTCPRGGPSPCR
jgi:CubicO group peptidase (beta-lactamase class C family)